MAITFVDRYETVPGTAKVRLACRETVVDGVVVKTERRPVRLVVTRERLRVSTGIQAGVSQTTESHPQPSITVLRDVEEP